MGKRVLSFCSLDNDDAIRRVLRSHGHSVLWVIDLDEALAFLRSGHFDLIVMDGERSRFQTQAVATLAHARNVPVAIINPSGEVELRRTGKITRLAGHREILSILGTG